MPNSGPAEAERRIAMEQALASTRISGHEPTPEFLADCEALINGTLSEDQVRAASAARAAAMDRELTARSSPLHGTTSGHIAEVASTAARNAALAHALAGRLPAAEDLKREPESPSAFEEYQVHLDQP